MWMISGSKPKYFLKGALSLLAVSTTLAFESVAKPESEKETLTQIIDTAFTPFNNNNTPGCAIGVQKDGQTLIAKGYGLADVAAKLPISPDTHFNAGSVSKQFTVLAILQLQAEDKLSLDDPIQSYIPEMPPTETPITIRHLIHHTSGLMSYTTYLLLAGFGAEDGLGGFAGLTRQMALEIITSDFPLASPVGSEWSYNNGGYVALAEVVKRVSGEDFETYARKHILETTGMKNSYFRSAHDPDMGPVARGYKMVGDKHTEGEESVQYSGDGGLITTLNDFLIYLGEMDNGETLWDIETRNFMTTPGQLTGPAPHPTTGSLNTDYGGAILISSDHEKTVLLHGGHIEGYNARWRYYPEEHLAMAAFCNSDATNSTFLKSAFNNIADYYFGEPQAPKTPPEGLNQATPKTVSQPLSTELISRFTGTYVSEQMKTTYSFTPNGPAWKLAITSPYSKGKVTIDLPPFTIRGNKIMAGLATLGFEIDANGSRPINEFYLSASGFPRFKFIRIN